ncbi:hypothetical protein LY78DRAFT_679393 [Colletotrichum sublineola]|nr:hypothetical protein LY78DRAFT_679393 [Colletotrichum sublineola]
MDRKAKGLRRGEDPNFDNPRKRNKAIHRNDGNSTASTTLQEPSAHSEFHGTGLQNSGSDNFTARDIYIGSTSGGELERELLRDLRVSDPRDDKIRIERTKGGLLRDSFRWVLDHDDFRRWQDDEQKPFIDALDECETDLSQLLHLIVQVSSTTQAKWLISSRNRRDIEQVIRPEESRTRLSLELKENAELVSHAVDTYISQCISQLAVLEEDALLQDQVRSKIQQKADGTFLWVSLSSSKSFARQKFGKS